MDSEASICRICYVEFDLDVHLPRVIPECGHSFCSECLTKLLKSNKLTTCPLDQRKLSAANKCIQNFPVNFTLSHLIEEQSADDLCHEHQERKKLVCKTDKEWICALCVLFGSHSGHEVIQTKDIKSKLDTKRDQIEATIQRLDNHFEILINFIEQTQTSFTKTITYRFEEMRRVIRKKELALLKQAESFFDMQKEEVSRNLGKKSIIRNTLTEKASNYRQLFKHKDFFQLIEENLDQTLPKISLDDINFALKQVDEAFELSRGDLDKSLAIQVQALSRINVPLNDLSKSCIELINIISYEPLQLDFKIQNNPLTSKTIYEFEVEDKDTLVVLAKDKKPTTKIIYADDFPWHPHYILSNREEHFYR